MAITTHPMQSCRLTLRAPDRKPSLTHQPASRAPKPNAVNVGRRFRRKTWRDTGKSIARALPTRIHGRAHRVHIIFAPVPPSAGTRLGYIRHPEITNAQSAARFTKREKTCSSTFVMCTRNRTRRVFARTASAASHDLGDTGGTWRHQSASTNPARRLTSLVCRAKWHT